MSRLLAIVSCLSLISTLGCSMCANPHDCKFAAYGGLRERADEVHGRVGSILDPAKELPAAAREIDDAEPTMADLFSPPLDNDAEISGAAEVEAGYSINLRPYVDNSHASSEEFEPFGQEPATDVGGHAE